MIAYKTLLVNVDDSAGSALRIAVASRLAQHFGAKLIGVYLVPTAPLTPSVSALLPQTMVEQRLAESGEAQKRAEARFRTAAAGALDADALVWRAPAGDPMRAIVAHARGADLVVIGQPDPGDPESGFAGELANAAILASGRPVLVVPYVGGKDPFGETVLFALDHSRESARAMADALPLLARARKVVIVAITPTADEELADKEARVQALTYLAGHGIHAEARHLGLPHAAIGETLLSLTADIGADLIVMGAYGHTRLQEMVVGGVTRTMLDAMTVHVLMSH
jgi:nucleotide-binding universal stress UspA family protein